MARGDKKQYSFSFTLHNVRDYSTKKILEDYVKPKASRYLLGCEEYPEQPGEYHLHLFVSFKNARYFAPVIQEYQDFNLDQLVDPKPDDREGMWGRVEVSKKYGTYQEAKVYLQGLTKDKPVDPQLSEYRGPPAGHIRCDVCGRDEHWVECGYQYPDRPNGRCFMCTTWRQSSLELMGYKVRNCDDAHWSKKYSV